jgi:putative hemolysin
MDNKNRPATHLGKSEGKPIIKVYWAHHLDEIKEAQRLRYKIFAEEMGAHLAPNEDGLDIDEFDDYCDHLLARDETTLSISLASFILRKNLI